MLCLKVYIMNIHPILSLLLLLSIIDFSQKVKSNDVKWRHKTTSKSIRIALSFTLTSQIIIYTKMILQQNRIILLTFLHLLLLMQNNLPVSLKIFIQRRKRSILIFIFAYDRNRWGLAHFMACKARSSDAGDASRRKFGIERFETALKMTFEYVFWHWGSGQILNCGQKITIHKTYLWKTFVLKLLEVNNGR